MNCDTRFNGGGCKCGLGVKKISGWINHVRKFAKDNQMTYACALSNPRCSKEYRETKNKPTTTTLQDIKIAQKEDQQANKITTMTSKDYASAKKEYDEHNRKHKVKGVMPIPFSKLERVDLSPTKVRLHYDPNSQEAIKERQQTQKILRQSNSEARRWAKNLLNGNAPPESIAEVKSQLLFLLNSTSNDDLAKVWNFYNLGLLPAKKELRVTEFLQQFRSIDKMQNLMYNVRRLRTEEPPVFDVTYRKKMSGVL